MAVLAAAGRGAVMALGALLAALGTPATAATGSADDAAVRAAAAAQAAGFTGVLLVADGPAQAFRSIGPAHDPADVWPWASVTKQVVAVLAMQQVEAGRLALDEPIAAYLRALAGSDTPTVRQLLQHRSGLRNTDDSPVDAAGWPAFFTTRPTGADWCLQDRVSPPESGWRYNNCDTIVLGAVLETVAGSDLATLFDTAIARPAGLQATHFATAADAARIVSATPATATILSRFGAAGALVGPVTDLARFDAALAGGQLLGEAALAELWRADPRLGYMALGQWVFDAPLPGCPDPVRIVERRGGISRYQARNIILPDHGRTLIMLTDRPEEEIAFGEIWTGSGMTHDILAAAACS